MTTLHSKVDEILKALVGYEYATYHKTTKPSKNIRRDMLKDMGYEQATSAILKEVYEELERWIGEDEEEFTSYPDKYMNPAIRARNYFRAGLKSNLKLSLGKKDG